MDFRAIVQELQAIVGDEYVLHKAEDLIVFEYDGSVDRAPAHPSSRSPTAPRKSRAASRSRPDTIFPS